MRHWRLLVMLFSPAVLAGPIADGFARAVQNDAQFLSATPERDSAEYAAAAGVAQYAPEFRASRDQNRTEGAASTTKNTSTTYTVSQPVFDSSRLVSVLESDPRRKLAEATYLTREQELAQRYFRAVAESMKAVENVSLNQSRITAFEQQARSAKRSFEGGIGTVTDLRDAEVRLDQANASHASLLAQKKHAFRQLALLLGDMPSEAFLTLPQDAPKMTLPDAQLGQRLAIESGTQMEAARQNLRLAELGAMRAKGALLPVMSLVYQDSEINNTRSKYSGVSITIPIGISSALQASSASAAALKQRYQTQDTENKVRLDVERLLDSVQAGFAEVGMRLKAIGAAELSVDSNERSYKGGIKSTVDVLNAIQTLFQTRQDYVNAKLALAENLLNLKMQMAVSAADAIRETELLLRGSN
jgi:protease secretion system outer membrane protein